MRDIINKKFKMMPRWFYSRWLQVLATVICTAISFNFIYSFRQDFINVRNSEENITELVQVLHSLKECFDNNNDKICLPRLATVSMLLDKLPTSTILSGRAYDIVQLYLNSKHYTDINEKPELHERLIWWAYYDKLIKDERVYLPPTLDKISRFQSELKANYSNKLEEIDSRVKDR